MSRVVIEPLTRVEGHGRIELLVQEGQLTEVRVDLNEAPRLFEAMLLGRDWREVPEIVCRICGICSTVHKLAALTALERALAIQVPPVAAVVRELALLGGHIQSHALHLFCLVLPDFFGVPGILDLLGERHPLALAGLELKAFGNRLQEVFGGRTVHPVNLVPGGIAHRPGNLPLRNLLDQSEGWQKKWPDIAADLNDLSHYPPAGELVGNCLATGNSDDMVLSGSVLHLASGDKCPIEDYQGLLGETSMTDSHAKQAVGRHGPFLVGALARLKTTGSACDHQTSDFRQFGIYQNNEAQAWEIERSLNRVRELIGWLEGSAGGASCRVSPLPSGAGSGIAAYEAPRGLLVHCYRLDDAGRIAAADVVTPTAVNQLAIAAQIHTDLASCDDVESMTRTAEQIVRAFDPCISCAVHVLKGR